VKVKRRKKRKTRRRRNHPTTVVVVVVTANERKKEKARPTEKVEESPSSLLPRHERREAHQDLRCKVILV